MVIKSYKLFLLISFLFSFIGSLDKNADEINLGIIDEIIYNQSDFPNYYYSKLNDLNDNISYS